MVSPPHKNPSCDSVRGRIRRYCRAQTVDRDETAEDQARPFQGAHSNHDRQNRKQQDALEPGLIELLGCRGSGPPLGNTIAQYAGIRRTAPQLRC